MYLFSCNKPVALINQLMTLLICFSTNYHGALQSESSLFQLCAVLASAEMCTEGTVPCVAYWPGFAYSRSCNLCKYAGADTPRILENFIFFKCVVSQRRRLICISLRGRLSENAMIKLGHLLTCLFYIFF